MEKRKSKINWGVFIILLLVSTPLVAILYAIIQGTAKEGDPPRKGHTVRIIYPAICILWMFLFMFSEAFLYYVVPFICNAGMLATAILAIKGPKEKEQLFYNIYIICLVLSTAVIGFLQFWLSPFTFAIPFAIVGAILGKAHPARYAKWEKAQAAVAVEAPVAEPAEAPAAE